MSTLLVATEVAFKEAAIYILVAVAVMAVLVLVRGLWGLR